MPGNHTITTHPLTAAISVALLPATTALAQDQDTRISAGKIEEVIVTATKREESTQDIAASIQAIPESMLDKMGVQNLEDYARFIPSVSFANFSPGATKIVFRGVSDEVGTYIAQASASLYLDEAPLTVTGSQPDVRPVDIARVEALVGPQGTLYGGSAQSGTLRIITNQPDPSGFEAAVDLTLTSGSDSEASHDASAVVNIPLIEDKFAIRLVGFDAKDGGFIDNVFGHTPDTHAWLNVTADSGTLDNADVVEDDWNDIDYQGGRISARWEVNDDWAVTAGYVYQETEVAGGGPEYDPFVGDLQVVKFVKGQRRDEWDLFSLTVEGDLGFAQLVSATNFYDRDIDSLIDGTVYVKYYNAWSCSYELDPATYYWSWVNPDTGYAVYWPRYCFAPTQQGDIIVKQEGPSSMSKFTQEFRLSHQGEKLDWIVGLFYEDTEDDWISKWGWPVSNDYQDSLSLRYWESITGRTFPNARHGWNAVAYNDWTQKAVFGELTYRLTDQWTATVGGRYFEREDERVYYVENPETNLNPEFVANGISMARGKDTDFVPKLSLSYDIDENKMIYALYSEGFRPGGTNRGRGNPTLPRIYEADKLNNYEVGAKLRSDDGRVQGNITIFNMDWEDYQLEVVDPSFLDGEPWQKVVANVGNAHTRGVEFDLQWLATDRLSFGLNAISLEAETDSDVDLNGRPTTIEIPSGTRLPVTPEFKASAWAEYHWPVSFVDGSAFFRAQYSYTGDSLNQTSPVGLENSATPQLTNEAYDITDIRVGVIGDDGNWEVDLFVKNVFDERADFFRDSAWFELPWSSQQDGRESIGRVYTNRPREFGIQFIKHWGGE